MRAGQRITRGAYLPRAAASDSLAALAAWQSSLPEGAGFTGVTGAMVRGWWLPPLPAPLPVFIALAHDQARPRRPGLRVCRHREGTRHDMVGSLRVATATQILLTAGRDLSLLDLVVLADAALHKHDCSNDDLIEAANSRRHGAPLLRVALGYVDERSESPWETLLRMLLVSCDVPVEPQRVVRADGCFVARGDLWIRGTRRLMEYDGAGHREQRQQAADLTRDRRLVVAGWQRCGYTSSAVLTTPGAILREADDALNRPHRPERIRRWLRLLSQSSFTASGRARLAARWG